VPVVFGQIGFTTSTTCLLSTCHAWTV